MKKLNLLSDNILNGSLVISILILPLISGLANAQGQPEKQFNLTVTGADIQTLGEGLGTLPYGKVAPLMSKLQAQINEQSQPKIETKGIDPAKLVPNAEAPKAGDDIPK